MRSPTSGRFPTPQTDPCTTLKHAVKQVDRLLSNNGIGVWDSFARWVPHQIAGCQDILVAMDWTNFDHDDHATLVLGLVTRYGRAAPLLWLTVWKEELKNRRNDYEDACLRRLSELAPLGWHVTILADRGFGDQKLFASWASLASITSSASVATSASPMPLGRASLRPGGWARR